MQNSAESAIYSAFETATCLLCIMFTERIDDLFGFSMNKGDNQAVASANSVNSSTNGRKDSGMDVSLTCTLWIEFPATTVISYWYSSGLIRRSFTRGTSKKFDSVKRP